MIFRGYMSSNSRAGETVQNIESQKKLQGPKRYYSGHMAFASHVVNPG